MQQGRQKDQDLQPSKQTLPNFYPSQDTKLMSGQCSTHRALAIGQSGRKGVLRRGETKHCTLDVLNADRELLLGML